MDVAVLDPAVVGGGGPPAGSAEVAHMPRHGLLSGFPSAGDAATARSSRCHAP